MRMGLLRGDELVLVDLHGVLIELLGIGLGFFLQHAGGGQEVVLQVGQELGILRGLGQRVSQDIHNLVGGVGIDANPEELAEVDVLVAELGGQLGVGDQLVGFGAQQAQSLETPAILNRAAASSSGYSLTNCSPRSDSAARKEMWCCRVMG